MAGKAKRDRKIVINQAYAELLERKAAVFDDMFVDNEGAISVKPENIKTAGKILVDWDKIDAGNLSDTEPYAAK